MGGATQPCHTTKLAPSHCPGGRIQKVQIVAPDLFVIRLLPTPIHRRAWNASLILHCPLLLQKGCKEQKLHVSKQPHPQRSARPDLTAHGLILVTLLLSLHLLLSVDRELPSWRRRRPEPLWTIHRSNRLSSSATGLSSYMPTSGRLLLSGLSSSPFT